MDGIDGQVIRPSIGKATALRDGVLVEWASGLAILYCAALLWEQRDYSRAEREQREVQA